MEDSERVKQLRRQDALEKEERVARRLWRRQVGGMLYPPIAGFAISVFLVFAAFALDSMSEIMDYPVMKPVAAALIDNIQWFFLYVTVYDYLRYVEQVLDGKRWILQPMTKAFALTGILWISGLVLWAANSELGSPGLAQIASLTTENNPLKFALFSMVLYSVTVLEKILAR